MKKKIGYQYNYAIRIFVFFRIFHKIMDFRSSIHFCDSLRIHDMLYLPLANNNESPLYRIDDCI